MPILFLLTQYGQKNLGYMIAASVAYDRLTIMNNSSYRVCNVTAPLEILTELTYL